MSDLVRVETSERDGIVVARLTGELEYMSRTWTAVDEFTTTQIGLPAPAGKCWFTTVCPTTESGV